MLDPWLGTPQRKFKEGRVNLVYRFDTDDSPPLKLRLKIEINSREHFSELGLVKVPFAVDSQWFRGQADVTTFPLEVVLTDIVARLPGDPWKGGADRPAQPR